MGALGALGALGARGAIGAIVLAATMSPVWAAEATLATAVQKMDRAAIRQLIDKRADVNTPQVDGTTALHWAAYHDDLELANRLLSAGASVQAANRYGVTPLVTCLHERQRRDGRAVSRGRRRCERIVARRRNDADDGRAHGERGRGADAPCSRRRCAREGKPAGTDGADVGSGGRTRRGRLRRSSKRAPISGNRSTPGTRRCSSRVRQGHIAAVKALLKAGADVNEVVKVAANPKLPEGERPIRNGTTPLHLAIANAHFELASELLDAGADPNSDLLGYTVLHMLVYVREPGIGDNDPGPEGSGRITSLEFARKAVAKGAKIDARMTRRANLTNTRWNELGTTPFLLAAVTADAELMKTFVSLGADPLVKNNEGSTALMAAAGLGTRSPGEDAGTEEEVVEALQVALDFGIDINAVDNRGETAMHGAAYKNLPLAVKFLAAKGARIDIWNRRNENGWTPLTIARGYRFGNFKPSPVTIAAVEEIMLSAGITPPTEKEEQAKAFDIYAPPPPRTTTKP